MMSEIVLWTFVLVAAYLIGSIPTGFLVSMVVRGDDIRQHGSGNIGATNAFRVYGKSVGVLTLAGDVLKGSFVVWLATMNNMTLMPESAGLMVVIGHIFSCFLNFRGGKGVATALGVFVILAPWAVLLVVIVWGSTLLITRMVSVGSLVASIVMPGIIYFCDYPRSIGLLSVGISALIVLSHRENIKRLRGGREPTINTPTGEL